MNHMNRGFATRLRARAQRAARCAWPLALSLGTLLFLACSENPFALRTGVISVKVLGTPPDPGIVVTVFVRDRSFPYSEDLVQLAVGDSTRFTDLGIGFEIDVGIRNLAQHRCRVITAESQAGPSANAEELRVTTNPNTPPSVTCKIECRSATVDFQVSGLPPGGSTDLLLSYSDSAHALDPATKVDTVYAGPTQRLFVTPGNFWSTPSIFRGSDLRWYSAPAGNVTARSRATKIVTVQYQHAAACSATRPYAWYPLDGNAIGAGNCKVSALLLWAKGSMGSGKGFPGRREGFPFAQAHWPLGPSKDHRRARVHRPHTTSDYGV